MAKKLKKEDLELMSYNEIAKIIIKEELQMSTLDLFKKIIELLELPEQTVESKIGEFYTSLTNDKSFVLLDDGKWDLQLNHKSKAVTHDDDLEDYDETNDDYDDEIVPEKEDDMFDDVEEDDDISDITEEYKNLVIVEEDELEQE